MEKGLKKVGANENLQVNLEALREGRRMKMMVYGDMWYQFHLEKPGALIKQQTKAIRITSYNVCYTKLLRILRRP